MRVPVVKGWWIIKKDGGTTERRIDIEKSPGDSMREREPNRKTQWGQPVRGTETHNLVRSSITREKTWGYFLGADEK